MDYDPEQYQMATSLVSLESVKNLLQTIESIGVGSDQVNHEIKRYVREMPLPICLHDNPRQLHIIITANTCHHFKHKLPDNYQDIILEFLRDIGYGNYTLMFQLQQTSKKKYPFP